MTAMTPAALAYIGFGIATIVLLIIGLLASRPRKPDEFDGGYSHLFEGDK